MCTTYKHFFKCKSCYAIFALELPTKRTDRLYQCAICAELNHESHCESMGFVKGSQLATEKVECDCVDSRCLCAVGPNCDCKCGGVAHGRINLKITKIYDVELGECPKLDLTSETREKHKAICAEYLATLRLVNTFIQSLPNFSEYKTGSWIGNKANWWRLEKAHRALRKANKSKVQKTRIKLLTDIMTTTNNEITGE